jgi:hypothetical protein
VARFRLPDPPSVQAERQAVRASLDLADEELAPDRLTIPVLAAAYRAPLGPVDLGLILIGAAGPAWLTLWLAEGQIAMPSSGCHFDIRGQVIV